MARTTRQRDEFSVGTCSQGYLVRKWGASTPDQDPRERVFRGSIEDSGLRKSAEVYAETLNKTDRATSRKQTPKKPTVTREEIESLASELFELSTKARKLASKM